MVFAGKVPKMGFRPLEGSHAQLNLYGPDLWDYVKRRPAIVRGSHAHDLFDLMSGLTCLGQP